MFWFSSYKKDKSLSDLENILAFMKKNPNREYFVSEISDFLGYSSWTRVGDLVRKWLVKRSWTKKELDKNGKVLKAYAIYKLI